MVELSRTPADGSGRRVHSFVRREGRLTAAQKRALKELWPHFGLSPERPLIVSQAFQTNAPVILEIGFGNGESLLEMAAEHPRWNYLGIEVHRPGVGHLLLNLERTGLKNVRIYCADAVEILQTTIADQSLRRVNIFFPDPWPKKRHHKRRLIQPDFVSLLARKIESGGILHLATDWPEYARHMDAVVNSYPDLIPTEASFLIPKRPSTKYERRGRRLGHVVTELAYVKSLSQ